MAKGPFKMKGFSYPGKAPLKRKGSTPRSYQPNYDPKEGKGEGIYKEIHEDPLVQHLSRMGHTAYMSTEDLEKLAKNMRS